MKFRWFNSADYIERNLQVHRVKHEGGDKEYTVDCPNCGDAEHFDFSTSKQLGKCWKCDWSCNVLGFVMAVEGCDRSTAMRIIYSKVRVFGTSKDTLELRRMIELAGVQSVPDPRLASDALPKEYRLIFNRSTQKALMPIYLKDRGIDLRTAIRFRLGTCRSGRYGGRVVVPIQCAGVRSFVARDITDTAPKKYLNPIYSVFSALLFNYDQVRSRPAVTLVEGVFDVMCLWRAGYDAAGLFGKTLSDGQIALLLDSKIEEVNVMLDGDAFHRAVEITKQLGSFFKTHLIKVPHNTDPDDMPDTEIHKTMKVPISAESAFLTYVQERLRQL